MCRRSARLGVLALVAVLGCQPKSASPPEQPPATPAGPTVAAEDTAAWVMTGEPVRAPGGLRYWELERGEGAEAKAGMAVAVHYVGRLEDGSIFDDSYRRGAPLEFRLGSGAVIRGWDQGIQGMRVGGRRNLVVPPNLAYGERGYPGVIPPNATLVFQVVLTDAR